VTVAQPGRAPGRGPGGRGFKSRLSPQARRGRRVARRSVKPLLRHAWFETRDAHRCPRSSADRAPDSGSGGRWFDPSRGYRGLMTLPVRRPVCKTGSTGSTPDQASTPSTVAFAGGRWLSNRPSYRRPARFDTGACDRNDSRLEETQPATAAARRKNIRSPGGPTVPATNRSRGSEGVHLVGPRPYPVRRHPHCAASTPGPGRRLARARPGWGRFRRSRPGPPGPSARVGAATSRWVAAVAVPPPCSHGGLPRHLPATGARTTFTVGDVAEQTAGVECLKDSGVVDEVPGAAHKDLDEVMGRQADLVKVVAHLKQGSTMTRTATRAPSRRSASDSSSNAPTTVLL
jgi:tRNA-splicing ligase RtcB